jgi:hypothetical protein
MTGEKSIQGVQVMSKVAVLACTGAAAVMGILAVANGVFMLASPNRWYIAVPGVTSTGPFNQHFIRDIGLIYLLIGAMLMAGAATPRCRVLLWAVPTSWLCGHALFHFWEVAAGISGHSAMARDFSPVTLPGIIGLLITWHAAGDGRELDSRVFQDGKRIGVKGAVG